MTATIRCTPHVIPAETAAADVDTTKMTDDFVKFFMNRDSPVMSCDVDAIEKLMQTLYPYYFTHVNDKDGVHEISLVKNTECIVLFKCVFDMIIYGDRVFANAQMFRLDSSWEYTQVACGDRIEIVISNGSENTEKAFCTKKNMYVPLKRDPVVSCLSDLDALSIMVGFDAIRLFGTDYPYEVDYIINKRNFFLTYKKDNVLWKIVRNNANYASFLTETDYATLTCTFKSDSNDHVIGMCEKLCSIDCDNIDMFLGRFDLEKEFLSVSYDSMSTTFVSHILVTYFGSSRVQLAYIPQRVSIYFSSDYCDVGYTMVLKRDYFTMTVSTMKSGAHLYSMHERLELNYTLITDEPVCLTMCKILFPKSKDLLDKCCLPEMRADQVMDLKLMYFQLSSSVHRCVRKQIFDADELIFDGLVRHDGFLLEHTDTYKSPTNYEFILNNEKVPIANEYSYGIVPRDCDYNTKIFVNNCTSDYTNDIFGIPDFVSNKVESLCAQYVHARFNRFCVMDGDATLVYSEKTKLIAKNTEDECVVYDAHTGSVLYESNGDSEINLPDAVYDKPLSELYIIQDEIWDIFYSIYDVTDKITSIDCKDTFEIRTTYAPRMHGNGPGSITKTVATGHDERGSVSSVHQYNYDSRGHIKNKKIIDSANQYTITAQSKKEIYDGHIGYKAAKTEDDKMCIVTLYVANDAKVAWEPVQNKYRTNMAKVVSIKQVTEVNGEYYYDNDIIPEECHICMDAIATHLAIPCRHKLCGQCWLDVFKEGKQCYQCMSDVIRIQQINIDYDDETTLEQIQAQSIIQFGKTIKKAYSFVHDTGFVYPLGELVVENNFDGNLNKTCVPGIHYHDVEDDVFKYFEFMDIPLSLQIPTEHTATNIGDGIIDILFNDNVHSRHRTTRLASFSDVPRKVLNLQEDDDEIPQIKKDKQD